MDPKTWLWKKKSTEKTIVAADKVNLSPKGNEEEIQRHQTDKADLERDLKLLNDKLSLALSECNTKEDLVKKHAKLAQEAIAGWEKAEAEAMLLKQELDEILQQKVAGEERLTHLDAALKECMQQLRFVREEQEQRIHDAVMKTSKEFEKTRIVLEEKLAETNKRLSKLGAENTQLSKALLAKEKLIDDLNEHRTHAEADFNALMTRLESIEKENASLKYEVRVLEKELEIRNEEREFNRRTADVAHKQHLECVKKIAKLESECQRLRILVRKRLPGPAALAKMKSEVEMLGRDPAETRRRKSNPSPTGSMDFAVDNAPDTPSKRINFLTEQLCAMEEENGTLKEILNRKTNELQFSRIMYARTASKLSQVETQLEESPKGQIVMEPARNTPTPHELSLASMSDMGSDDKISCAESWASALISELEHFRNGKQTGTPSCKTVGASDINLMDDFVEMEKLAIVSVDKPFGSSHLASDEGSEIVGRLETQSGRYSLAAEGSEIVPASDDRLGLSIFNQEIQSKVPGWLQDILKVVLEQKRVTQRNPDEILEDIKVALAYIDHPTPSDFVDAKESLNHPDASNPSHVRGYISQKPAEKSPMMDSSDKIIDDDLSVGKKSNQQFRSNLSKSICKIIELIEGISLPSLDYGDGSFLPYKNSETPTDYMVRVFQWKTSELSAVLQQFVQTCNGLLSGKADVEKFAQELTSALDWIMNHCFSIQDVSSMRDSIKKHFDWDESRSEGEVEGGMISQLSEADKLRLPKEQLSYLPIVSASNGHNIFFQTELQPNVREDSKRFKDGLVNMENAKKDLEGRLQSEIDKSESLMTQLRESEKTIESLQTEVETLKKAKRMIEDQIENHKLVNEDLDAQLAVARVELNEARQMFSSLETELENKSNSCAELEATCLDLQLQLESVTKKEIPKYDMDREEKQLRTDWEITAASEKLAECQETILNLGKQLKALASPNNTTIFNKVISTPTDTITTTITPKKNINKRSSLLDKMLAEDNAEAADLNSPKTKEVISTSDCQKWSTTLDGNSSSAFHPNGAINPPEGFLNLNGIKHNDNEALVGSLAIVPGKKKGSGGFLKRLFWRRKKGNSKEIPLPFAA
uniref:Filament-like plant protein 7 n=1 Tax=Davidia involucrata TaxID=16924 RepID=A0A5B7B2N5_DAVIN